MTPPGGASAASGASSTSVEIRGARGTSVYIESARIVAPAGTPADDLSTFIRMTMEAAVENGRRGGRAVASGVMRPRAASASLPRELGAH